MHRFSLETGHSSVLELEEWEKEEEEEEEDETIYKFC
jgi:hypothetical protein